VQYQDVFGVWIPSQLKRNDREFLGRLASQWNRDPMEINLRMTDPLGRFVIACAFVVGVCRAMILRIDKLSSAGANCFVRYGPLSLV
jgi:hypothetical protein